MVQVTLYVVHSKVYFLYIFFENKMKLMLEPSRSGTVSKKFFKGMIHQGEW